jgi:polysaccharide biosynthesis/export protein
MPADLHRPAVVVASTSLLLAAIWICASARAIAQQPAAPAAFESCPAAYVIGPEDVLDISVWGNGDLTRTVVVRPDGKISIPLLNDIQTAGLTPMALRDRLTKALAEYLPSPVVSVIVREVHSFKVTVIGEVKAPGRYEVKDRPTVLDVLAMAGGLNEFAARNRIVVMRQEAAGRRQIPFPYSRVAPKGAGRANASSNFCLQPGDIILVP